MTQYLSDQACSQAIEAGMVALWKCTEKYININDGKVDESMLMNLSSIMETYCLFDIENKASSESLVEARQENCTDKTFQDVYEGIMKDKKRSFPNPRSHAKYKTYEKKVEVLMRKDSEILVMSQGDEELVITQAEVNTVDPITKQQMSSPVKNKNCGHSYEKTSIIALFKKNKRLRCPYVGCPSREYFTEKDLEEDYELKQIIQRQRSQQQSHN